MNCYEKLNLWLSDDNPIYEDCKTLNYDYVDAKLFKGRDTFLRAPPTVEHFKNEPKLVEIMKKYGLMPQVFLLEPNTVYNWHVDAFRYFAINCLLSDDDDYLTIFINDLKYVSRQHQYFPATRLKYEPRRFYILNSHVPHFVANYSDKPRHMLTIAQITKNRVSNPENPAKSDFSHFLNMVSDLREMGLVGDTENATCNTNI
jgi:hypothetical protein